MRWLELIQMTTNVFLKMKQVMPEIPNQNLELTLGKISEIYANGDDLQLTRQQYEAWLLPFLLLQE